ncbi:hypothetical protein [Delftia acidovorans]
MQEITKSNLPEFVNYALTRSSINPKTLPNLALIILQSGSIEFSKPPQPQSRYMELIVVGKSSRQAVRTSGNHVNVFALSSALLSAVTATTSAVSAAALLVAVLGACTVSLTPEQAAFFVAADTLKNENTIPTAVAYAKQIAGQLKNHNYSSQDVLSLVGELINLGVPVQVGDPPNNIIRHAEWSLSVPGF